MSQNQLARGKHHFFSCTNIHTVDLLECVQEHSLETEKKSIPARPGVVGGGERRVLLEETGGTDSVFILRQTNTAVCSCTQCCVSATDRRCFYKINLKYIPIPGVYDHYALTLNYRKANGSFESSSIRRF